MLSDHHLIYLLFPFSFFLFPFPFPFPFFLSLAGVASGATRAALTQHFALQNNAADISAKVPILLF
jgi:hypothetical protein